eukprot:2107558-Alexandrium_andersonii.AAC.1
MSASLVGSEMCIRDRGSDALTGERRAPVARERAGAEALSSASSAAAHRPARGGRARVAPHPAREAPRTTAAPRRGAAALQAEPR